MKAENLTGPVTHHGEGPVWSEAWSGLRFVDMLAGTLVTVDRSAVARRLDLRQPVAAFVRPRAQGGYVVATERGLGLSDDIDAVPTRSITVFEATDLRMNEGGTDPEGRLYAGSMAYSQAPGAGTLYRIGADLKPTVMLTGVTVSNGLAFSAGGRLCYYVDTPTGRVDVFDHVAGELLNRRTFVSLARDHGLPDGLTLGADGSVWVALWGGGAVHGYSPDGQLISVIELPVSQVTACTFGGDALDTLYITTSRQGLPPGAEPEAGSLFAVQPGAYGTPVIPFAG